ncbi:MAG: hypothetical protein Ta2G_13050 [Termitinemataceae bacterium]|nr:MAG: hypothetical protein Ta2G_13050 [Termitinemataceae bacterium]
MGTSKTKNSCAAILLVLCFASCADMSQTYKGLGKSTDAMPFIEEGVYGTLQNGLRYYILQDKSQTGRVFASMAVDVGSADEKEQQLGFANFTREIITEGNAEKSVTHIRTTLYNFNDTTYTDDNGVKKISSILFTKINNILDAPSFRGSKFISSRSTILAAIRNLSIKEKSELEKAKFIYGGSVLENRVNVLGTTDSIENARDIDVERFYKSWYRADNIALIFIGDFDSQAVKDELESKIKVPQVRRPFDRVVYELSAPKKNNIKSLEFKNDNLTGSSVSLYYKMKPHRFKNNLQGFRNTLNEQIILSLLKTNFAGEGLSFEHTKIGHTTQYFVVNFPLKSGSASAASVKVQENIKNMVKSGISDAFLLDMKQELIAHYEAETKKSLTRDRAYALFLRNYLYQESAASAQWRLDAATILLPQITKAEINKTLKSYFATGDLHIFMAVKNDL